MSAPVKLFGFAAVLALVFGVATVAGGAVGPDRADDAAERADTPAGHGEEPAHGDDAGGHAADAVRGLAVADDGLRLSLASTSLPRGREATLRFTIDGPDGPVRDFDVEHEKRMHLIVVRRDGTGFQHLHPKLAPDGTWSTPVTLPDAGAYRVFADFKRGENETLAADLTVDGDADYRALPERTDVDTTDGYTVGIDEHDGKLGFDDHPRRQARRDRALPRRRRPPGRAARGRSRLPARAPGRRATASSSRPSSTRTRATACTCSSSTRARSTRRSSRDERPDRAADHGHDVRVVREPDRAQAEQARRRRGDASTTRPRRRPSPTTRRPWQPEALVGAVEAAGYQAVLPLGRARASEEVDETAPLRFRADRLRAAVAAGAAGLDDPGAAVRQLAVAGAEPGHAGRGLGRLAVPPRRVGQPAPRHGDDGHADLARRAVGVAVVAVRADLRRRRHGRHADGVRPDPRARRGFVRDLPRDRRGRDDVHPRRPLLRGARQAPRRRRADGAARAGRQGGLARRRPRGADRGARRRRALRRPPGREGRHRRRRRGRPLGGRHVAADRRVRAGRGRARATRSRARPSTPAAGSSCARRRSAPTPRWRRSPGS